MNNLHRGLAPISEAAWAAIDAEASRVLKRRLAARRLVDFKGPLGEEAAALNLGRLESVEGTPGAGVTAARRAVAPLVHLQAAFALSRSEIDAIERGAADPDLAPVIDAATRIATAEDTIVFHGFAAGGIRGMCESSSHKAQAISEKYEEYPHAVAEAVGLLRAAGIEGPYALALGPRCYAGITQATAKGGYPILDIIRNIVEGPVVWAPAIDGAVVLAQRGGDFELTVGQDFAIGYRSHDAANVQLYLTESLAFRVITPEAAVPLKYR